MQDKMPIKMKYKKQEHVSMEKLSAFIAACRLRKSAAALADISNAKSIHSILVVISDTEKKEKEKTLDYGNGKFSAPLRECPLSEDIPIYIHATRRKTVKKNNNNQGSTALTEENIQKYLMEEIDSLYTEGVDHRLYTIPISEKKIFYKEYSSLELLNEVSQQKPLVVKKIEKEPANETDSIEENSHYYDVVLVNKREMVTYYKNTSYSILAIDCEMVLTDLGTELARISIVDGSKAVVYDQIVEPSGRIVDYISQITGITESSYKTKCMCRICKPFRDNAEIDISTSDSRISHTGSIPYEALLYDLSSIVGANTVLVGHSISHDLMAMNLFHRKIVDTSLVYNSRTHHRYKLQALASTYLKREIQQEEHSSVVDAQTCIDLLVYLEDSLNNCKASPLEYARMKNISITTQYAENQPVKKNKTVAPIAYVFASDLPQKVSSNTVIVQLVRENNLWTLNITNT
ncbi:RNA exonuclease [Nematocida minor]|uniref:RNA exonuclease n=1 Tax=Nematocida minor TaxID=1912983 RepID=UPI002220E531|nr:RNA exonuclease [Nematocida minor]KAI5192825.1 RNA exonuclease [Nematocida minor]